eukprot:873030_1
MGDNVILHSKIFETNNRDHSIQLKEIMYYTKHVKCSDNLNDCTHLKFICDSLQNQLNYIILIVESWNSIVKKRNMILFMTYYIIVSIFSLCYYALKKNYIKLLFKKFIIIESSVATKLSGKEIIQFKIILYVNLVINLKTVNIRNKKKKTRE